MATTKGERSKEAIHAAASELFASRGYSNTTVRDIASLAEVDPALVIRHFGSKEKLFLETMQTDADSALDLDGPIESLGERLVHSILKSEPQVRSTFLALVRASDTGNVGTAMRVSHEQGFVAPLLARLSGPNRETRARLAAAMIGGLMYSLWIAQDEHLLRRSTDELVATYAPALQVLIDGERRTGG
jgi:AcrR family transcriptional regulator